MKAFRGACCAPLLLSLAACSSFGGSVGSADGQTRAVASPIIGGYLGAMTHGVVALAEPISQTNVAVSWYVSTEATPQTTKGPLYGVSQILQTPGSTDVCGFDVARLVLTKNAPASAATPLDPALGTPTAWLSRRRRCVA